MDTCMFTIEIIAEGAPNITCPFPVSNLGTDLGVSSAVVLWSPAPSAADDVDTLTADNITCVDADGNNVMSGGTFDVGITTVTCSVIDSDSNLNVCRFTIEVVDDEIPIFLSVPDDINITTDAGQSFGTPNWDLPTASDNNGNFTLMCSHQPGDTFDIGTTTVTCTVTDQAGNTATVTFNVTVFDDEMPIFLNVPDNINVTTDDGESFGTPNWDLPTASDNGGNFTLTCSDQPGNTFDIGTTRVTCTVIDQAGNTATVKFNVTVIDDEMPIFLSVPENINVTTEAGQSFGTPNWDLPTASDNSGNFTLSCSHQPGATFDLGATSVTCTVTDQAGNSATVKFNVTVIDDELPIFLSVPEDINITTDAGQSFGTPNWDLPTASDNSGNFTLTCSHQPGDTFDIGTTTVTCTIMDAAGNTATVTFNIIVIDDEKPIFLSVPENINVTTAAGQSFGTPNWDLPTASDNSGNFTLSCSQQPGDTFDIGTTTVTCTVTDEAGNTATVKFNVTVIDDEMPIFLSIPENINITTDDGQSFGTPNWDLPTASDNSSNFTLTCSHQPGDTFDIGTTTVTCTIMDEAGNTATVTFNIIVIDDEKPIFLSVPENINVTTDAGQSFGTPNWDLPTASDNSGNFTLTCSHQPGDTFDIGTTTVTCTVTDEAGNPATVKFNVTVIDDEMPIFLSIPENINITTDDGQSFGTPNWDLPTASDNSGNFTLTCSHQPGDTFDIGTTTVTCTVTDEAGNTATVTFNIIVIDDKMPVFLSVPENINITTDAGQSFGTPNWDLPTASDNSGNFTLTCSHQPGDTFDIGTTTVTCTVTDQAGNSATVKFNVTVIDDEMPILLSVPENINITTDEGQSFGTPNWDLPTASDNSGNFTLTCSHQPGDTFDIGATTVTCTVTDEAGNTATVTLNIIVIDDEKPIFLSVPENISVTTDAGQSFGTPNWDLPTASDNSGNFTLTCSHQPGDTFDIGTTTVSCTVMDEAGNTATVRFNVTVIDDKKPIFLSVLENINITTDAGQSFGTPNWDLPTASDNSGNLTLTCSHQPGDTIDIGTMTVSCTVMDEAGNTATVRFNVTVIDDELPIFLSVPENINITTDDGQSFGTPNWDLPTASDNSGNFTLRCSHQPGDTFDIGTTTVTCTVTDEAGNTATVTFNIIVIDDKMPVFLSVPENINITTDPGQSFGTPNWDLPTASDSSGNFTLTCSHQPGDPFDIGTTTVTCTVTDQAGNTATVKFNVTVIDDEMPILLSVPENINITTDDGLSFGTPKWDLPTASDNSGNFTLTCSHQPGDAFDIGTTTVTCTIMDEAGNTATVTFNIVVIDDETPIFVSVPHDITITTDDGESFGTPTWDFPTVSGNSGNFTLTCSRQPGDTFGIETTMVTCTVTDEAGNTATVKFYVTVIDEEKPIFLSVLDNINITTEDGQSFGTPNWDLPTASDNSGNFTLTCSHQPGDTFDIGTTTVTCAVTDEVGNTATAKFNITVIDDENPIFLSIPENINITTDAGQSFGTPNWDLPTVSDNSGNFTLTCSHQPGDTFDIGTMTVTCAVTDKAGNTAMLQFDVVVSDNQAPIFLETPGSIYLETDPGEAFGTAAWTVPTVADNSGNFTLTSSHRSGETFDLGPTTVTYTATDGGGNTASVEFVVHIIDNEVPIFLSSPGDITISLKGGAYWNPPTASDNSGNYTISGSHSPGDTFSLGATTVIYTATDASGNTATVQFVVYVTDECDPGNSTCPGDLNCIFIVGKYTCDCPYGSRRLENTSSCIGAIEFRTTIVIVEFVYPNLVIPATFPDELLDPTTDTFKNMQADLERILTEVYRQLYLFIRVRIYSFFRGSIGLNIVVTFDNRTNATLPMVADTLNDSITRGELLSASIYKVTPSSIKALEIVCGNGFCLNGGTCIPDASNYASTCRCLPGYFGARCNETIFDFGTEQPPPTASPDSSLTIILTVLGCIFLVVLLLLCCCFWFCLVAVKRRRQRHQQMYQSEDSIENTDPYAYDPRMTPRSMKQASCRPVGLFAPYVATGNEAQEQMERYPYAERQYHRY
ncbi:hyalin-like isoform X7 [Patiria miniata]|uniref:Hyalin n=1 Tax=Patiria miniata TaxID=46514 RepID=A0A914BGE3_PATMI|nr:hyalin-like isoform X7 [Patiria miniata]